MEVFENCGDVTLRDTVGMVGWVWVGPGDYRDFFSNFFDSIKSVSLRAAICPDVWAISKGCFHNHLFEEAFVYLDASSLFLREAKLICSCSGFPSLGRGMGNWSLHENGTASPWAASLSSFC